VQLRYKSALTSDDYVSRQAWRNASLSRCPLHSRGRCSFSRHGTYRRKRPTGTEIARWYCPQGHTTFSLLPDFLAAQLPGSLSELEHVVAVAEQATSLEAAANTLRPDAIELPGAVRWVRRRVERVRQCLLLVIGLLPDRLSGCAATISQVRERLGQVSAAAIRLASSITRRQLNSCHCRSMRCRRYTCSGRVLSQCCNSSCGILYIAAPGTSDAFIDYRQTGL